MEWPVDDTAPFDDIDLAVEEFKRTNLA